MKTEYGKKFLIIGNMNCCTYKEIFPYIKNNKMWMGASTNGTKFHFVVPTDYVNKFTYDKDGKHFAMVNNSCWWTNIWHKRRSEPLDLYKKYSVESYPKYDNYDAIDSKTDEIPIDYDGVIGVPISFLGKYCPEQFEIVGMMSGAKGNGLTNGNDGRTKFYINDKGVYARILIRKISF